MAKIRLFPLLALVALTLLVLKSIGLFVSGSYVITGQPPALAQDAATTKPEGNKPEEPETKDTAAERAQKTPADGSKNQKKTANAQQATAGPGEFRLPEQTYSRSKAEEGILKNLAKRRANLDSMANELRMKENLLKAAEKQLASRLAKLKELEAKLTGDAKMADQKSKEKLNRLVKMYSTMKPAAAARIFNRLDISILKDFVGQMKTRKMAPILAAMDPARAELLTLEIANQKKNGGTSISNLPKIQSK